MTKLNGDTRHLLFFGQTAEAHAEETASPKLYMTLGLLGALAAGTFLNPVTAVLVLGYGLYSAWQANEEVSDQLEAIDNGLLAHLFDAKELKQYEAVVGKPAIMAELAEAKEAGLELTADAKKYLGDGAKTDNAITKARTRLAQMSAAKQRLLSPGQPQDEKAQTAEVEVDSGPESDSLVEPAPPAAVATTLHEPGMVVPGYTRDRQPDPEPGPVGSPGDLDNLGTLGNLDSHDRQPSLPSPNPSLDKPVANSNLGSAEPPVKRKQKPIQPIELSTDKPETFDWNELDDGTKYPHLLILGKSGAGKTTLARMLLETLDGQAMVITPHVQPGDWNSSIKVVGAGRDYSAIGRALKGLVAEMTRRYGLFSAGQDDYPTWSVVLDETSSIMAQCPGAGGHLGELVREGRKVKIRLIVLAHGMSVRELGCEGEGAVRKNYTFIKLRGFIPEAQLKELEQDFEYPALVNDVVADVNQLQGLDTSTFSGGQDGFESDNASVSGPDFPVSETDFPVSAREIKVSSPETETARNDLEKAWRKTGNGVSDHSDNQIDDQAASKENLESRSFGLDGLSAEDCQQRIRELKTLNHGMTRIIELIWGASAGGGPAYQRARQEYRHLTGE